jgi:hypothetical protein
MDDYEISTASAVAALKAYRMSFDDRVVTHRRTGTFEAVRYECGCTEFREFQNHQRVGSDFHQCAKHGGSP